MFRISITGLAPLEKSAEEDQTDMFDRGEFISTSDTAADEERLVDGQVDSETGGDGNETAHDQKETVFKERKPLLLVNVENVLDEKFNQDQELKVSKNLN